MRATHKMSKTHIYKVWSEMKRRCKNPNSSSYCHYGGRGITYAPEWEHFEPFFEWAIRNGYDSQAKYGDCTIDRIDVNGNYCPENCRWISLSEQTNNTTRTRKIKVGDEEHNISEWGKKYGMNPETIRIRIDRYGYTEEEAVTKGLFEGNKHNITFNGETRTIKEWSLMLGGTRNMVAQRLNKGWSLEKALTTPIKRKPKIRVEVL